MNFIYKLQKYYFVYIPKKSSNICVKEGKLWLNSVRFHQSSSARSQQGQHSLN